MRRWEPDRVRLNWPLVGLALVNLFLWLLLLSLVGCASVPDSAARSCAKRFAPGTELHAECTEWVTMKTYEHLRQTPPAVYAPVPSTTPPPARGLTTPGWSNHSYTIDGRTYNCNNSVGHTTCN